MTPEQMDEISAQTLTGNYDDDLPWDAVRTLQTTGSREVFERAADWCRSEESLKRARGLDILAQLGKTVEHPKNNFLEECFSVVSRAVEREKDPLPLRSAVHALGHIGNALAVPLLIEHRFHPSVEVRFAVAFALGNFADDERSVCALLALMRDVDEDVRDWATFGLGVQGKLDSQEIRDGLADRLTDTDRDVRGEALCGLAKRHDTRALRALIAELNQAEPSDMAFEAAEAFLDCTLEEPRRSPSEYIAALNQRFAL
jgi:HEAT repeat protein